MRGESNKNIDTKFRRISQQNVKNIVVNYIHEVPYKNCLEGFIHCSTKTPIPGVFKPSVTLDLYAQILHVLHKNKASVASSVLVSFSAS